MNSQAAETSGVPVAGKKVALSTGLLALALGSGLGATPAEATLVTTPLNVTVSPGQSLTFGPHNDEFTITNFGLQDVFATGCGCDDLPVIALQGNVTALSKNFVAVKAGSSAVIPTLFPGLTSADPLLDFYNPGDQISDASSTFAVSGQDVYFKPASNVVYGLQSVDLADPFGYVQLDVLPNADLHLDKFAFQNTPGEPATVIPEPGTLSLFAVGGAALLAARRRKKQQKTA